jgi:redox-sensitive bicupin YhaK (pirin superfamily)
MASILQTFQLSTQWPTLDPFLFCAHHLDDYPNGTVELEPDASLNSRNIGQDFDGIDGWNMYHGKNVPGFPQHPHRGFETITYVRTGVCDHSDSMGATARFGSGDTQWMTAGKGIVHCEMFPMLNRDEKNPLEIFQIWLNLPAVDKMVDPYFTMLWSHDTPTVVEAGPDGQLVDVTVIAGSLASPDGADGVTAQAPPPNSWAARAEADLAIWHLRFDPGASWTMPAATGADTNRILYAFTGSSITINGETIEAGTGAVVDASAPLELIAGDGDVSGIEIMVLQGGWPWPSNDPTHGSEEGRFAHHADGKLERFGLDAPAPAQA